MKKTLADLLRLFILMSLIVLTLMTLPVATPDPSIAASARQLSSTNPAITNTEGLSTSAIQRKADYVPTHRQLTGSIGRI